MANKHITDLPQAGTITGAEILPLEQNGVTSQATVQQLLALLTAGASSNLDTFFEVATRLGLDETTVTTLQTLVAGKADTTAVAATYSPLRDVVSVISADTTATPNRHHPVTAGSSGVTLTLPTGQPAGTIISVEKSDGTPVTPLGAVTVSGLFRSSATASTIRLNGPLEALMVQAKADGTWWPIAGHKTKSWLDSLYTAQAPAPSTLGLDTTVLTQLATAAAAAGGGTIRLQAGTYVINAPLPVITGVTWQGNGRAATTIQLANGANCDVFKGQNFDALTGTGANNNSGATRWAIRDLTIDGNRANQAGASYGLRVYGCDFDIERVTIRNCFTDGMWTEWGYLGQATDGMEARYIGMKIHGCNGWGWRNRGPHDSLASNMIVYENNQAGTTGGGIWVENDFTNTPQRWLAGALQLSNSHIWGVTQAWGVVVDGSTHFSNVQVEGAIYGQVLVRAPFICSGGKVFNLSGSATTTNIGIQLGDDSTTPGVPTVRTAAIGPVDIDTHIENFWGSSRSTAPLAWVNCFSSSVRASILMASAGVTKTVGSGVGTAINALTTLALDTVTGMPNAGQVSVQTSAGTAQLAYTGITGTTLTGISVAVGTGTATLSAGSAILVVQSIWGTLDKQSHLRIFGTQSSSTVTQRAAWSLEESIGTRRHYGLDNNPTLEFDGLLGHIRTPATAMVPTITLGGGLGSTVPTPTITGTDTRGQISLGTGTSPLAATTAVTVNLANSHPSRNPVVVVTPANAAAAALQPYATATGLGKFNIGFAVAPAASQPLGTYYLDYIVIG